jgi:hypothetical protein
MKFKKSIFSVILSKKENKFYSLSLCESGGSIKYGLGNYSRVLDKYKIFNDEKEYIDTVDCFENVLTTLQIKSYIVCDFESKDILNWFNENLNNFREFDDFSVFINKFKESKIKFKEIV